MKRTFFLLFLLCLAMITPLVRAQEAEQSEREAMYYRYLEFASYVKGGSIQPHWMADGSSSATIRDDGKQKQKASVLGDGRGIDHVIVFVRDLEAAKVVYRDTLGFLVEPSRGTSYTLPSGFKTSWMGFEENWLEWRAVDDREKAAQSRPKFVNFLEKHEGALLLILAVSSAKATVDLLRVRGFNVSDPQPAPMMVEGTTTPAFWCVTFSEPILPGPRIFFCEYAPSLEEKFHQTEPQEWTRHPNTARGIKSVWIAVRDLKIATKAYEAVGLPAGQRRNLPELGARGREIQAGRGVILLLEPQGKNGRVASFLADRGEGIMGVSIEVGDLIAARRLLETTTKQEFTPYVGPYGTSILIPAELSHGLSIEMFQR
jgi:catechol 2,3-dioxygenase-like lactoylglutathione lyase family enzyme